MPPLRTTAKLFTHGRSRAVRLPRAFRFSGTEVRIHREGNRVVLEPLEQTQWPKGFWDLFGPDPEFAVPEPLPTQPVDRDT